MQNFIVKNIRIIKLLGAVFSLMALVVAINPNKAFADFVPSDYTPSYGYIDSYTPSYSYTDSYTPSYSYTDAYTPSYSYTDSYTPSYSYTDSSYTPSYAYTDTTYQQPYVYNDYNYGYYDTPYSYGGGYSYGYGSNYNSTYNYNYNYSNNQAQTFNVSCSASPSVINQNQSVTFTANASGANGGNYTYSWSGIATGSGNTIAVTPSGTGTQTESVTVTSGSLTRTAQCSVYINSISSYNGLDGSCYASQNNNNSVTWYANAFGGNGNYSYSWSGDAYGSGQSVYNTYNYNSGTKYATVTIYSNGQSVTRSCQTNLGNNINGNVTVTQNSNGNLASGVFLSQIPYTGITGDWKMTLFILAIILWSAFVAYIILKKYSAKSGKTPSQTIAEFKKRNLAIRGR